MIALVGLACASIAIHVDETRGIDEQTKEELVDHVARAVEARTGSPPRIDDSVWAEPCDASEACFTAVRGRTGSSNALVLEIVGGPTKIRVLAARSPVERAECDVPRDRSAWTEAFDRLLSALSIGGPSPVAAEVIAREAATFGPWPWIAGGAGVAAIAVAIGFGAASAASSRDLDRGPLRGETYTNATARAHDFALTSNLLSIGGAVLVAAGLILLVFE
jgi:hypothetical protein